MGGLAPTSTSSVQADDVARCPGLQLQSFLWDQRNSEYTYLVSPQFDPTRDRSHNMPHCVRASLSKTSEKRILSGIIGLVKVKHGSPGTPMVGSAWLEAGIVAVGMG